MKSINLNFRVEKFLYLFLILITLINKIKVSFLRNDHIHDNAKIQIKSIHLTNKTNNSKNKGINITFIIANSTIVSPFPNEKEFRNMYEPENFIDSKKYDNIRLNDTHKNHAYLNKNINQNFENNIPDHLNLDNRNNSKKSGSKVYLIPLRTEYSYQGESFQENSSKISKRFENLFPMIYSTRIESYNNIESNPNTINLRVNKHTQYPNNNFANTVDLSKLSYQCSEIGCEWCDKLNTRICKQCKPGFFLYNAKCYAICPKEYIADIYTRSCTPLDNTNVYMQISYLKAFSVGSCKNLCGKVSVDCSCTPTCINEGNCCADYHICENLEKLNKGRHNECYEGNPHCDLCDNFVRRNDPTDKAKIIPYKCGKCREGLFLKYGECVQKCSSSDKIISPNQICFDTMSCLIQNCAQCAQENSAVCRTCENGHYLHNNQCLKECPYGLRADRISWSCLEPPVAAWYWIWPSRASCRLRCGRRMDFEMDCSCSADCFFKGDCCVDVEDYCPQFSFWK